MEVTRVITIEMTAIDKVKDESEIKPKEQLEDGIRDMLYEHFENPDSMQIKIQDFIREEGDADEQGSTANEES